jgi:hypothetical protein
MVEESDSARDSEDRDPRLLFLGEDPCGVAIEVVAVEYDQRQLLAIHAMPLRNRYRPQYEEATKWRR